MRQRPTVGVLVPYVGGFYFASLLVGVKRAAREFGARVVAFQTTGLDMLWPGESDTLPLGWDCIDGWVGINDYVGSTYYDRIAAAGKPLVTVSARLGRPSCGAVLPDNQLGIGDAVRHLVGHGHRRIAFCGFLTHTDIQERYDGYVTALREAGITPDPSLFYSMNSTLELDGREVGRRLVAAGLPCTAIVAGTDLNALGVMNEVKAAGYRVPDDLAVIGFDDVEQSQYADPPLATVRMPFELLARRATQILLSNIVDGKPLPEVVRVPAFLVPRGSCGCTKTHERVPSFAPGPPSLGDPTHRQLTQALLDRLAGAANLDELHPSASTIAVHLYARFRGEVPVSDLGSAWTKLLESAHDAETVEALVAVLESAARAWRRLPFADSTTDADGPRNAEGERDVSAAVREMRFELMRAWRNVEQARRRYCDWNAEANRKIDLALIGADLAPSQELSWLRWARVRHGTLGVWTPATANGARSLTLRGVFHSKGPDRDWVGSVHSPACFPSPAMCALLDDPTHDDILSVVPITGRGPNRGLMTVVGPIELEIVDSTGNLAQWAALLSAAMDREELLGSLRQNAFHDALTGLPNRTLLMDRLDQAIARAQQTSSRFGVLFLDIDRFKTINDSLGHVAGDELLMHIAARLSEGLRTTDTIARLGGDEFAIVVGDLPDEAAAVCVAERVQESLRAPFAIGSHLVFTSASVGITMSSEKILRAEDFLRNADTAMYRAKSQGRGQHQLFDGLMHKQAMDRLSLEAELRRALERDELVLHFQPLVALDSLEVVGVEALIRWQHPERGLLLPLEFLPVAEESGLIAPISDWVMRSACDTASAWQSALRAPMRVSINVPPQQLKDVRLVGQVRENLRRTGLRPEGLGLEIVESSLVETSTATIDTLLQLRAMGITIAIDDFGTGYSSLSYLKRLPIDALKIDRSFTSGIPSDPNDMAISATVIAMARSLKLKVVAEGVETREQVDVLRGHGCHVAQGYYFSRPLKADECLRFFGQPRSVARTTVRPTPSPRISVR